MNEILRLAHARGIVRVPVRDHFGRLYRQHRVNGFGKTPPPLARARGMGRSPDLSFAGLMLRGCVFQ